VYIDSLFGFVGLIALVGLIVVVARQNGRIGLLEREIGALRSLVLSQSAPRPVADVLATQTAAVPGAETRAATANAAPADASPEAASDVVEETAPAGPWTAAPEPAPEDGPTPGSADTAGPPPTAAPPSAKKPDIETALGTRWAVWVGGIALALGGLFLVRYSIEAGFFGPAARIVLAALLGLVLVVGGEFIRRTGYRLPVEGAAGAYIPAILTASGIFVLFGTVYSAHALYGFIGPALAFLLLGALGLGSIVLALIHGQALAGIGLLGALATPLLVASQAPSHWALFVYLAVVLAAATAVARIRSWRPLVSAAFAGTGLWCLVYMADVSPTNLWIVLFINAVMLASLALLWLGSLIPMLDRRDPAPSNIFPAAVPAFFIGLAAFALLVDVKFGGLGGPQYGALLIAAMLALAAWRPAALPLLFGAGIATLLAWLRVGFGGDFAFEMMGENLSVTGFPAVAGPGRLGLIGALLGLLFLGVGLWKARALVADQPVAATCFSAFAGIVPVFILFALWVAFGNPDRELLRAILALALAVVLAAGGEAIARREVPPLSGGNAVSFALGASGAAFLMMLHMAFGSALTTILVGASAVLPALATRLRRYPVLGGLSVAAVIMTLLRIAADPTIVGAAFLSTTPVFNALLPGYGVPALAFAFAAWQFSRTTAGRPRLVMEAAAALFALLTLAMLVRHAMNGGVINSDAPTLAEQSIYSLIALGAGAILIALDMRSPSSVLRIGSLAAAIVSVASIATLHLVVLNPLFTDEATGSIPVFNLLFLAYLMPAIAAGAVALYAREKRPRWYAQMLGLTAAVLLFVYATLSVRRLFKGEFIGLWSGLGQWETYSYSALWLAMGVALLVVGVRTTSTVIRLASAALIAIAVAKVFLFDMSELEGVLRALSFIGLGAVLIGIGLFYQRLLTRAAR
jgi:uncharacterized membrane protein